MNQAVISVFADASEDGIARARIALALADARSERLCVTVVAPMPMPMAGTEAALLSEALAELRRTTLQEAHAAGEQLKALAPDRVDVRVLDFLAGDLRAWAGSAARTADLVIVGQPEEIDRSDLDTDIFVGALLGGGRPCLMIPRWSQPHVWGRRVFVAWKGTPEASRALHGALPFLKTAEAVRVCLFNPRGAAHGEDERGMAAISDYLQHHGIVAEPPLILKAPDSPERAIASELDAFNADLLVMGAYGRPQLQEIIFGGMTVTVVRNSQIPVLLAH